MQNGGSDLILETVKKYSSRDTLPYMIRSKCWVLYLLAHSLAPLLTLQSTGIPDERFTGEWLLSIEVCFVLSPLFLVCSAYKYAARSFFFSVGGQETQAQSGFKGTVQSAMVSPDKSEYRFWSWLLPVAVRIWLQAGSRNMVCSELLRVAVRIQYGCRRLSTGCRLAVDSCRLALRIWIAVDCWRMAVIIADGFQLTFFGWLSACKIQFKGLWPRM